MRRKLILNLVLLATLTNLKAQEVFTKTIQSNFLKESKTITIALPEGYEKSKIDYPLTVILNSGELFNSYLASSKLFCNSELVPQQIIVGIEKTVHDDELHRYEYDFMNSFPSDESINTLKFIKQELLPALELKYRVAKFKTIVGNNLTANFASYFLFEKDPVFNGYMCLNPEYAKDMPNYLRQYSSEITNKDIYYYFSEGNTTSSKKRNLIDNADDNLHKVTNSHFKSKHEHFERTSNLVSIPQSIAMAQEYVFTAYSPINRREFKESVEKLTPNQAIDYLLKKYDVIKNDFGKELTVRVEDFIQIEDIILDSPESLNILKFSELALKLHPQHPLGDFYKGYYFEKNKKYKEALVYYKRGYRKIPYQTENADKFFKNIKRVAALMKLSQNGDTRVAENSAPVKFNQIYRMASKN